MKTGRILTNLYLAFAVVLLCLFLLPTTASAATYGDFEYTVSNGEATITGYTGTASDITIPAALGGCPVTKLGEWMFLSCDNLTTVNIPDSVSIIGEGAFYGCSNLVSITIPNSITKIGVDAFAGCIHLVSVTIPDSVSAIYEGTFYYCESLTTVTIPDNVTYVGENAFYYCYNLTNVYYGGTESQWGSISVDYGNDYLQNASVHFLDLEDPNVTNYTYFVENGEITITGYTGSATDLVIPDTLGGYPVTTIGDYAFFNCDNLQSVTIPDSVTTIGEYVFEHSSNLQSVIIGDSVTGIGFAAFYDCTSLQNVTIGDSVIIIGDYAFSFCRRLTCITLPDSVTTIAWRAFRYCENLQSITIPDSVTTIDEEAFADCTNLSNVIYSGTKCQWEKVSVSMENNNLLNAVWVFNKGLHSFTDYVSNDDATYDTDGTKTAKCDYCVATDTVIDPGTKLQKLNGWVLDGGKWYYNINGVKATGWVLYGKTWYYMNASGVMCTGWLKEGNTWYYLKPSGAMATGWAQVGNIWYYFNASGVMQTGWLKSGNTWYYLQSSGAMATGWQKVGSVWYYFQPAGGMATGWVNLPVSKPVNWYGAYTEIMDEYVTYGVKYAYCDIDNNGIPELLICTGSTAGGIQVYYYHNGSVKNSSIGEHCAIYSNGVVLTTGGRMGYYHNTIYGVQNGEIKAIASGHFEEVISGGEIVGYDYTWEGQPVSETEYYNIIANYCEGEAEIFNYYEGHSYEVVKTELKELYNSKTFGEKVDRWYFFNASGAMATGWAQVGGKWYYFASSGAMVTGWAQVGGKWYYFNTSGAMVTGWQKIGSVWYYFQSGGAMQTGWLKLGSTWYYFNASGAMATGSVKIGTKTYRFNASGACLNP